MLKIEPTYFSAALYVGAKKGQRQNDFNLISAGLEGNQELPYGHIKF